MRLTFILEVIVWAIGMWLIITQIVLPAWRGKPFFPILRGKPREAERTLADAIEASEVDATLKQARKISKSNKTGE